MTVSSLVAPAATAPAGADPLPGCGTDGTPGVIALADPSFYIDSSAGLFATYAGYTVRAGSESENGLWLSVGGFTGGVVSRAPGQPADVALPNIAAVGSATSYLLLAATGATTTSQSHTVTLYRGHPLAGDAVCSRTYTYRGVFETIKALANKVDSVTASVPTGEASIGDLVTVTVEGRTGTLGAGPTADPGVLSYAPNALHTFPAGAWRLEKTTMTISPDGDAPPVTYINRLYLAGASGPNREYTAEYLFRAIGPAATPAAVQPVQYIASGTQVKHTDIGGGVVGALPAVSRYANLVLAKTAAHDIVAAGGGPVEYTLTATNVGATAGTIDRIVDVLPPGATFKSGSGRLAGRTLADPNAAGRQLTWSGPITVPAGGGVTLAYTADLAGAAGAQSNSAVAYYGNADLDMSRDVTVSDPAVATVTVLDGAGSARGADDSAATAANQAVVIDVLANDSSTAGLPIHVASVGDPGHGTATTRSDGSVLYTPAAGFAGTDSFSYTVSDGFGTDGATVSVTVSPIARNDAYVTAKGTTLSGASVLGNDACPGCTVSLVTNVASGTLTLASNGTFTYAAPNQHGVATFGYLATAPGGTSATAIATIYVNAAGPDSATTAYASDVTVAVTANDTCPGGGNCNISAGTAPGHGTATYNGTNVLYRPASGFWGLDSFTYNLNGGAGATVTLLVAPPAAAVQTTYGQPVDANLAAASFTGVTTASCSGCLYGVAVSPTSGTLAVTAATGAAVYTPEASFAGTDAFSYTVTDPASGLTVTGTATVTVGPNASDDTVTTPVDTDVVVPVLDNDACPGTCTVTVDTVPATGTASFNEDGTITFSSAPARDIGDVTFTYRIESSLAPALSDTAIVTVTVRAANDDTAETTPGQAVSIPVRGNDPCQGCTVTSVTTPTAGQATIEPDGDITYEPPAGFSGTDTFTYQVTKNARSSTATVTVTVLPRAFDDQYAVAAGATTEFDPRGNDLCAGCVIDEVGVPTGGGTAMIVDGQAVRYTPGVGAGLTEQFTYRLSDTTGQKTTGTVTVTVNAPPAAVDDDAETDGGTAVLIDVAGNDTCFGCSLDLSADAASGTVVFRADGRAQYQPAPGFTGLDSFRYLINDPATGLTAEGTVTVTVVPVAVDDRAATARGTAVVIAVLGNDVCAGCTVAPVAPTADYGSVTVNNDGTVTYTPGTGYEGADGFAYRLTDPATNRTAEAVVVVTVSNATDDAATTAAGTAVDIDVLDNDTACLGCVIEAVGNPEHGTATLVGDSIHYEPADGFWGLDAFTYHAGTDGASSTATVRILVAPPDRVVITYRNVAVDGHFDPDGVCAGCEFDVIDGPASGDIDVMPVGEFSYTPLPDTVVDDVVTYRATDPLSGNTVTGRLTMSVRLAPMPVSTPELTLVRTLGAPADTNTSGRIDAGDTITSTYSVSNTGNVTVTGVTVSDAGADTGSIVCPTSGDDSIASLAPAAGESCTGTHTLTQADIDAGGLSTTATAAGMALSAPVSDTDTGEAALPRSTSMTVEITVTGRDDRDTSGDDTAGDDVHYAVTATNTGTTTLSGTTISETRSGGQHQCATLAPAAQCSFTATYRLTQAEIDAATVTNTAASAATGPGDTPAEATDAVSTPLSTQPPRTYAVSGVVWFDRNGDGQRSSGEPVIPGAAVSLEPGARSGSASSAVGTPRSASAVPTTKTGTDGRYLFVSVAPGTYTVTAATGTTVLPTSWDTDGQQDWHVTVTVTDADTSADFASQPAGSIAGAITERIGGQPIAGAALSCIWPGLDGLAGTDDDVVFPATTGADGTYGISAVPAGKLSCTATDPATGRSAGFGAVVAGTEQARADAVLGSAAVAPPSAPAPSGPPSTPAPSGPPSGPSPSPGLPATLPVTGGDPRRHLLAALALLAVGAVLRRSDRRPIGSTGTRSHNN